MTEEWMMVEKDRMKEVVNVDEMHDMVMDRTMIGEMNKAWDRGQEGVEEIARETNEDDDEQDMGSVGEVQMIYEQRGQVRLRQVGVQNCWVKLGEEWGSVREEPQQDACREPWDEAQDTLPEGHPQRLLFLHHVFVGTWKRH